MRKLIRWAAVLFLVGSISYYLWHGLTGKGGADDPTSSWVGPQMMWPIIAMTIAPIVLAFTGDSVVSALTGRNSTEFRDALIGVGTVRSAQPTGVSLNDQPELRLLLNVLGINGEVFESQAKMVVPLTDLASLQPGAQLPVRYLPGRSDKVEVDRSGDTGQVQAAMNQAMIRRGVTTQANLDIVERGVRAQAVVQELRVPGQIRDGNSRVQIRLAVTRPNGTIFSAEVVKFLPPPAVPLVQAGSVLTVHYAHSNERQIVLSLPSQAWTSLI